MNKCILAFVLLIACNSFAQVNSANKVETKSSLESVDCAEIIALDNDPKARAISNVCTSTFPDHCKATVRIDGIKYLYEYSIGKELFNCKRMELSQQVEK